MSDSESYHNYRKFVSQWKSAAQALASVHAAELAQLDTCQAIAELSSFIDDALERAPYRNYSGLVEQQRLFAKLRDEQAS